MNKNEKEKLDNILKLNDKILEVIDTISLDGASDLMSLAGMITYDLMTKIQGRVDLMLKVREITNSVGIFDLDG